MPKMQIKVLLVNPNSMLVEKSRKLRTFLTPILPLGVASIAAVLEKEGIEVKVIDQFANKISSHEFLDKVKSYNPDIIGISCITPVMGNVRFLINEIRKFSKAVLLLGNIHPTIFTEELLREGLADIVVRGEGEISMLETVLALREKGDLSTIKGISFRNNGIVTHNPDRPLIDDLDTLPYPAWNLFELDYYKYTPQALINNEIGMPILGSRGCPYRCVFCAQDKVYKKVRYRKNEEIVKELEYMYNKFNARYFGFLDACFPFSIDSGIEFCQLLTKSGLHKKIRWCTETRVDLVNEDLLVEMKKAGVHLMMFGLESGNQQVLDRANKGTTLEQARKAIKITKKLKIYTLGLFILGLPGETRETCEETIKFAKELDCDVTKFNLAIPYPGSRFFENIYKDKSVIPAPEKFNPWCDWADGDSSLIYCPEGMNDIELIGLQRKAMFEFYVRPKVIINYLRFRKTNLKGLFYGAYVLLSKYFSYLWKDFFRKLFSLGNHN